MKRDDCTGLAGGGNKARKLEPLCRDAIARAGELPDEGAIVYLHTGGLPALFADGVAEWVRDG